MSRFKRRLTAIETRYAGRAYRSRTEARWAVFFDCCGMAFQYEADGYHLPSGPYLPDFWLTELQLFVEIKGKEPSEAERRKCAELAEASGCVVLLAIGAPEERFQIIWFDGSGEDRNVLWVIAKDRRVGGGFWLVADNDSDARWLGGGDLTGLRPRYGPMFSGALEQAYAAALSARFEHGATPTRRQAFQETADRIAMSDEPDPLEVAA